LALQDDGNLVLYAGGHAIWWTGSDLAATIVTLAKSQLGTAENPLGSGCNPYTAFFGRGSTAGCAPGTAAEAWCSDFADWVWANAGAQVAGITGWSYTFVEFGQFFGTFTQGATNDPQPGDGVVWGDLAAQYGAHVGIVVGVKGGQIDVVSGNGDNHVYDSGYFNPATSTLGGYSIVGYTSPIPAAAQAPHLAPNFAAPPVSQAQINTQDLGQ
jgi:hypothetical protein